MTKITLYEKTADGLTPLEPQDNRVLGVASRVDNLEGKFDAAGKLKGDADTLDGKHATDFVPLNAGQGQAGTFKGNGDSQSNTGFKLANGSDIGTLFKEASYSAVQSASVGNSGSGNAVTSISGSVSGSSLSITASKDSSFLTGHCSYCSHCSYCNYCNYCSHCGYCSHCSYCTYCTTTPAHCSNCSCCY